MRRVFAIKTLGLQTVDWTLWCEPSSQAMKQEDRTRTAVDAEQRDFGSVHLDRHKRSTFRFLHLVTKQGR